VPSQQPDRSEWGRIGSLERWSKVEDRTAETAVARSAFLARFDEYPDPEAARKAYFRRLALKSAESRRRKKAA
jgi:hypothetical protein